MKRLRRGPNRSRPLSESGRRLIATAFLWPAVWYGVFAWTDHVAVAFGAVVLAHFGGSVLWVYSTVMLQRSVPDAFQGRVMATDLGLATLLISVSIGGYGVLAEMPGADLRRLTSWMALSLIVPTAIWLWASRRWPPGCADGPCRDDDAAVAATRPE